MPKYQQKSNDVESAGGICNVKIVFVLDPLSGFYPPISGIKLGATFPPPFVHKFSPLLDSSTPSHWAFFFL